LNEENNNEICEKKENEFDESGINVDVVIVVF